jgi:hypothetical protein
VLWSLAYLLVCRLFELMMLCCSSPGSKELEILVLRHELSILRRQARRPQLREADRLFSAALSRALPRRAWSAFSVSPRTLLRWRQRLVARRWTYPHRRPGRPPVDRDVEALVVWPLQPTQAAPLALPSTARPTSGYARSRTHDPHPQTRSPRRRHQRIQSSRMTTTTPMTEFSNPTESTSTTVAGDAASSTTWSAAAGSSRTATAGYGRPPCSRSRSPAGSA